MNHFDIDFDTSYIAPGLHVVFAKKLKLSATTLPILIVDKEAIQGSANIIDWAQRHSSKSSKSLMPSSDIEKCLEVEKRLDDVAGVHIRRFYYSEAVVGHPHELRRIFSKDLSFMNKMVLRGSWSMVRKLMIKGMDLGKDQREESRDIIEDELDWLDDMLSNDGSFLVGDRFSRADLTAASLLAPIASPNEHPVYNDIVLPPKMKSDMQIWQDRPSIKWVRNIYSQYR